MYCTPTKSSLCFCLWILSARSFVWTLVLRGCPYRCLEAAQGRNQSTTNLLLAISNTVAKNIICQQQPTLWCIPRSHCVSPDKCVIVVVWWKTESDRKSIECWCYENPDILHISSNMVPSKFFKTPCFDWIKFQQPRKRREEREYLPLTKWLVVDLCVPDMTTILAGNLPRNDIKMCLGTVEKIGFTHTNDPLSTKAPQGWQGWQYCEHWWAIISTSSKSLDMNGKLYREIINGGQIVETTIKSAGRAVEKAWNTHKEVKKDNAGYWLELFLALLVILPTPPGVNSCHVTAFSQFREKFGSHHQILPQQALAEIFPSFADQRALNCTESGLINIY